MKKVKDVLVIYYLFINVVNLLISFRYLPWYLILMFFAWFISCSLSVAYLKSKYLKWTVCLYPTYILTIGFIMIVASYTRTYVTENNFIFGITYMLNIPSIYFIGCFFDNKLKQRKRNRKLMIINEIKEEIICNNREINELNKVLNDNRQVLKLVNLLQYTGEDVRDITNNKQINKSLEIIEEIKNRDNKILELKRKINVLNNN